MSHEPDFDRSIEFGTKALDLAQSRKTPATPKNYELFYNYVAGEDRALVEAVDTALSAGDTLDDSVVKQIHSDFVAPERQSAALTTLGTELSAEIDQVLSHTMATIGQTSAYGDSLAGATNKIAAVKSGKELQAVIETLIFASREMERNSRDMESKLNDSREQIAHLNKRLEEVRNESRTDALTGIANRKRFDEALAEEMAAAAETQEELCLCLGDIDHFKKFNDTYGHNTGDQVLRLVASSISRHVKGRDLAARYGGEEFAVLLPQTNLRAAVTVADQIRKQVQQKQLVKRSTGENLGTISMSLGVSRYRPGEAAEEFIARADACLYAAKNAGRNQVKCEADPDIASSIQAA